MQILWEWLLDLTLCPVNEFPPVIILLFVFVFHGGLHRRSLSYLLGDSFGFIDLFLDLCWISQRYKGSLKHYLWTLFMDSLLHRWEWESIYEVSPESNSNTTQRSCMMEMEMTFNRSSIKKQFKVSSKRRTCWHVNHVSKVKSERQRVYQRSNDSIIQSTFQSLFSLSLFLCWLKRCSDMHHSLSSSLSLSFNPFSLLFSICFCTFSFPFVFCPFPFTFCPCF